MKKAQILSALALAFALGVAVIPTASTYAYVVGTEDGKEVVITDSTTITELKKAIAKAQETKTAEEYAKYAPLVALMNGDTDLGADNKSLNTITDEQKTALLTALSGAGVDSNAMKNDSYANIYKAAVAKRDAVKDVDGQANVYTSLKNAIEDADEAIEAAEKAVVEKLQAVLTADFKYTGNYLTTNYIKTVDGKEVVDYAGAIAYAKNQAPEYAFYSNLVAALEDAQDVVAAKNADDSNKYTEDQAAAALTALNNAIAGKATDGTTGEGTNKPGDDKNEGNKAPNTGILAGAEGSASTTVAMVAGVATALTAAGAGVVAYRNARRSTRK